jgi:hypothetical protein
VRRGTLIVVIALFVLLVVAAIYQFTLGGSAKEPLCGPQSPGAQPTPGACRQPSASPS